MPADFSEPRDEFSADEVLHGDIVDDRAPWQASKVLALLLDDLIKIPGLNRGIGLDGLIGLIPGVGDASTTVMSGVIFVDAIRNRIPVSVLARMALNIVIDAVLGAVPTLGDLFDFAHRANRKNYDLLKRSIENREEARLTSTRYLLAAGAVAFFALAVCLAATLLAFWLLLKLLGAI